MINTGTAELCIFGQSGMILSTHSMHADGRFITGILSQVPGIEVPRGPDLAVRCCQREAVLNIVVRQ